MRTASPGHATVVDAIFHLHRLAGKLHLLERGGNVGIGGRENEISLIHSCRVHQALIGEEDSLEGLEHISLLIESLDITILCCLCDVGLEHPDIDETDEPYQEYCQAPEEIYLEARLAVDIEVFELIVRFFPIFRIFRLECRLFRLFFLLGLCFVALEVVVFFVVVK